MERARRVWRSLPRLRLPTWAKQQEGPGPQPSLLAALEGKLVAAQEVALWTQPVKSLACLVASQLLLYYLSSRPLVPTMASTILILHLYTTWVHTIWPAIRVPDRSEDWTPLHPATLSAPELETVLARSKARLAQMLAWLAQYRQAQPGRFCLLACLGWVGLAWLGQGVTTPTLLHCGLLLALTLPGLVRVAGQHPATAPAAASLASLAHLLLHQDKTPLEEFVPEQSEETESLLERATSLTEHSMDRGDQEDLSLLGNLALPGHEEVENDSLSQLLEFERGLAPNSARALEQSLERHSSEEEEEEGPNERMRDYNDSDSDSLELEVGGGVLGVSSAPVLTASPSSPLGSLPAQPIRRVSGVSAASSQLDDFEFISPDELDLNLDELERNNL